ncbi:DNA adenine methylase [Candidatus Poriferisodalis multihospitum]|uniref:DNA adenine methylase n=1 Tax=Candidatus Poriferisodalis multihospitum TaxID=2983191 RepID=UPI002B259159|nr:DNA adenine methylase [Candidatus Poriferisodalis multihospitum]
MAFLSPLRYPGGKGLLLAFVQDILSRNVPRHATYVEPFAGGAGVALGLLKSRTVERAVIGDADPRIAAFWRAVTEHHTEFVERVERCNVNIETWHKQASIVAAGSESDLELGFATFFLNRTNHSGVIDARPIGGLSQNGPWPLDCRFNKLNLIERLRTVRRFANQIVVREGDGVELVTNASRDLDEPVFIYADPPYLTKSADLYLDTMTYERHKELAHSLSSCDAPWIVSYDVDDRVVEDLYPDMRILQFGLRHSARRSHIGRELMVFSQDCDFGDAVSTLRNATWRR